MGMVFYASYQSFDTGNSLRLLLYTIAGHCEKHEGQPCSLSTLLMDATLNDQPAILLTLSKMETAPGKPVT